MESRLTGVTRVRGDKMDTLPNKVINKSENAHLTR